MKAYKLTDQNMRTYKGFQWELGVERVIDTPGNKLGTSDVFHYYDHPLTAVLFNPIHADILNPRLFAVECDSVAHDGCHGGAKRMRLIREIDVPVITTAQFVRAAILCAMEFKQPKYWTAWARDWLSGKDRTEASAAWASAALAEAAWAAALAAARAAAGAAEAARVAARVAAMAAVRAEWAVAKKKFNLVAIIERAIQEEKP